ncbi:hypothetical protein B0A48_18572 [Cryoendolithus antarcticus]|uniref:6-methylsalicylate decarboxylase n=1 Tax=Cryoendolithus antarcticus TaxID=1507870 RepID=A0A1V8S8L6_9PEZI|nr:hypothetical protein B0A48_18572 [Cryoendolithus antarcticus]
MPAKIQGKIDVHHHVYPPAYTAAIKAHGGDPSGWYIPSWTVEADHAICREIGISTAILSCTAPGPGIEPDVEKAQQLARTCNEFSAGLRDADPTAYGFFASVPSLLDTKAVLEEIDYALDVLNADGVVLMTRYGSDNHYLGHPSFIPIWDALNKRKAIVFVHPSSPANYRSESDWVNKNIPGPAWDYAHETGRTAIDLITSSMLRDHARECKIILAHAGGTLPYLVGRAAGLLPYSFLRSKTCEEYLEDARMFYYDTALSSLDMQSAALRELLKDGYD